MAVDAEGAPAEEEWGADEDEEREEPASVDERLGAAESEDDMVWFVLPSLASPSGWVVVGASCRASQKIRLTLKRISFHDY